MPDNQQSDGAQRQAGSPMSPTRDAPSRPRARQKRICIVGLGSISQNPRVVKEADALAAAGYDVVVLFLQHFEWARAADRQIFERAKWRADSIEVFPSIGGRIRRFISALRVRLFQRLCRWTMRSPVVELAYSRYFLALLWRAIRHRGDLYIGHYTGSLPVVAWAAWWTGTKYAFDFEDFHRGEVGLGAAEEHKGRLIAALEDRYLPGASFVTAASWAIADEVAKTTGLSTPTTVLNVFPWSDRESVPVSSSPPPRNILSLYWFSQIVSLDRGLQDVIGAMSLMTEEAELHIRGNDSGRSVERLKSLAKQYGIFERVHFHSVVPPVELLANAADHDVGLCLEVPALPNRDVCITNKIFIYMLAGLAIAASRTRAQAEVLHRAPEIGFLYDSGDVQALAGILDRYARDRALLTRTKTAALEVARTKWNWERESRLVVEAVHQQLSCAGAKAVQ
jgi:glycosyltransferase involved in cell wall biosynthesis